MHERHYRKVRFLYFFWDYKYLLSQYNFSFFLSFYSISDYFPRFIRILLQWFWEKTESEEGKKEKYAKKNGRIKRERKKRKISQLSTATEIVIMDQHGIQLRKRDELYLSGRSDQEPHHYSSRMEQKTSSGGRVVRSLKYHLVTAYWRAVVPPNSPRNLVHGERARGDPRCSW